MTKRPRPGLLVTLALATWWPTAGADEISVESQFLTRLVGEWSMEGQAWPAPGANPYPTGSNMSAAAVVGGRAVLRRIEAPQVGFEGVDLLSLDGETGRMTYIYFSTSTAAPVVLDGELQGGGSRLVLADSEGSRTEIEFQDDDTMIARDYQALDSGAEWMSREVFHRRLD